MTKLLYKSSFIKSSVLQKLTNKKTSGQSSTVSGDMLFGGLLYNHSIRGTVVVESHQKDGLQWSNSDTRQLDKHSEWCL
jgi:hypothetical protein